MKNKLFFILTLAFLILIVYCVYAYDLPKWFPFNEKNALRGWQEKIFKDRVLYVVETKYQDGYLRAQSDKACSGLLYKLNFSPLKHPMMSWQWKVTKFPDKSQSAASQSGWLEKDDYAARVYVIFPSWNIFHIKSLEYIWDESLPEETVILSPNTSNIKIIVAQSGKDKVNDWVFEERDILQDYKKAFGKTPTQKVGAIALMTDADNTLSTAEALYKEIKVGYSYE